MEASEKTGEASINAWSTAASNRGGASVEGLRSMRLLHGEGGARGVDRAGELD
jgi:hypothetical protein